MAESMLECAVCCDIFVDPRNLNCGHSFCKICIETCVSKSHSRSIACPQCRAVTAIPSGAEKLPVNWLVKNIVESKSSASSAPPQASSSSNTPLCIPHEAPSVLFCNLCCDLVCSKCIPDHSSHSTSLLSLAEGESLLLDELRKVWLPRKDQCGREYDLLIKKSAEVKSTFDDLVVAIERHYSDHQEKLSSYYSNLLGSLEKKQEEIDLVLVAGMKARILFKSVNGLEMGSRINWKCVGDVKAMRERTRPEQAIEKILDVSPTPEFKPSTYSIEDIFGRLVPPGQRDKIPLAASISQQRKVLTLLREPVKSSQRCCILPAMWLRDWLYHIEFQGLHPGLILTESLVERHGNVLKFKIGLTQGKDYQIVPANAWNLLISWYGHKGPAFCQKAGPSGLLDLKSFQVCENVPAAASSSIATEFDANHVNLVMSQCGCTREKAIEALRKTNGDLVNAILDLTVYS